MSLKIRKKIRKRTALLLLLALLLTGCGGRTEAPLSAAPAAEPAETAEPAPTPEPAVERLRISELMSKNRAVLRDGDGDFSDWVELENYGDHAVDLDGWRLTDRPGRPGLALSGSLDAGERLLVWASGKDRPEELHAPFSLSEGESVLLCDAYGRLVSSAECLTDTADRSVALGEDGSYAESRYPTPGFPNTSAGYDAWQESLRSTSPLIISEACVHRVGDRLIWRLFGSDWVELKNVSEDAVELSGYYLSDDHGDTLKWRLPDKTLMPGAFFLIRCDDFSAQVPGGDPCCGFSLDAGAEDLFLSRADGTLADAVFLRDIPYGGSYGRSAGENGWFFYAEPTPAEENGEGFRRVSRCPRALEPDGVFNKVSNVSVALEAPGEIYYIFGNGLPTTDSERYEKPFRLEETTVVRAIAVEEGALPSPALTLTYIINENHSLPVLSLVSDQQKEFLWMYANGTKEKEIPGSLSLYEEDGSFTIGCGIRMHGETSLKLEKKNMSIRFRSVYGRDRLDYDIYDGGVDHFRTLVLRAGQDYYETIIKNALAQNLCLAASEHVVTTRSKFCVLYVNGKYLGIYNLMEKTNEQLYADLLGVDRDTVEVIESQAGSYDSIYQDLLLFCRRSDLSVPENYAHVQELLDIDSLIDWIILEGYCANVDLTFGNLRYCRSSEGDGKWRLMFYDLDATFWDKSECFSNVLGIGLYRRQAGTMLIGPLLRNEDFRARLLARAGELLRGPLSTENVTAEMERLAAIVEPEVERDYAAHGMNIKKWEYDMDYLRAQFADGAWNKLCVDHLCQIFALSAEQRAELFGE